MNIDKMLEEYKYERSYIDKLHFKLCGHSVDILSGYYSYNDDQKLEILYIVLKLKKFLPSFIQKFKFLQEFECDIEFDTSETKGINDGIEHGLVDISFSLNNINLDIRFFPHHHENDSSSLCNALGMAIFFSVYTYENSKLTYLLEDVFHRDLDEYKLEEILNCREILNSSPETITDI